jgi:hypothetical protein
VAMNRNGRNVSETYTRVPVDPFQEAFRRSGLSANELAERLGFRRYTPGTGKGDGIRVLRILGLRAHHHHRGQVTCNRTVPYETAVRLADAMGVDYHEVGV